MTNDQDAAQQGRCICATFVEAWYPDWRGPWHLEECPMHSDVGHTPTLEQQRIHDLEARLAQVEGLNEDASRGMSLLAREIRELREQVAQVEGERDERPTNAAFEELRDARYAEVERRLAAEAQVKALEPLVHDAVDAVRYAVKNGLSGENWLDRYAALSQERTNG